MSRAWAEISPSMDDVPVAFGWDAADKLSDLFDGESDVDRRQMALKAISEFAVRLVTINMTPSEAMARQLEAMAAYVRKNTSQ